MRAYPTMKKNNPYTPIMLRGAQGTEPRVFARYGMFSYSIGEKKQVFWKRERTDCFGFDWGRVWQGEAGVAGWCVFCFGLLRAFLFFFFCLPRVGY